MATSNRRIEATLGGVTRSIGEGNQDLAALERRRARAEVLQRKDPEVPFAEYLHATHDARAAAAAAASSSPTPPTGQPPAKEPAAAAGAKGGAATVAPKSSFVPRGRQRIVRG